MASSAACTAVTHSEQAEAAVESASRARRWMVRTSAWRRSTQVPASPGSRRRAAIAAAPAAAFVASAARPSARAASAAVTPASASSTSTVAPAGRCTW